MVAARDAAAMGELAAVPLHPNLAPREVAYVLDHARPRAVLVEPGGGGPVAGAIDRHGAFRPAVLEIPPVLAARRASGTASGAALPAGATVMYTSGSSETGTVTVLHPDEQLLYPDTVGRPVPGVELRLERPHAAVPGEVFVRSATVMSGYWNPTSESVEWPGTGDGFVSVGDLGEQSHAGAPLRLIDRMNDMIISGGVNVYPAEVERALHEHPEVAAALVCGVADPRWQQRVAALVVRTAGSSVSEDDLRAFLRGYLAPHKIPKQIVFVAADDLPRSASGKLLRRAAVALLE